MQFATAVHILEKNYQKIWNSNKCVQLGCTVHFKPVDIGVIDRTDSLGFFPTETNY